MKKLISLILAVMLVTSVLAVAAVPAGAVAGGSIGGYGRLGEYEPLVAMSSQHLRFALPKAWLNKSTEKVNNIPGIYWWQGYDECEAADGSHGWPGYQTKKEVEEGVDNLFYCDVPAYGNGEENDAMTIVWNNYIDGGTEDVDLAKNPYFADAQQSSNVSSQFYSRSDNRKQFEDLFRYTYVTQLKNIAEKTGEYDLSALDTLDMNSETFWVDLNKICAYANGESWDDLDDDEKTWQADTILDDNDDILDFSEYGAYASNFFNEDGVPPKYMPLRKRFPRETSTGACLSFTFDNMVYVVDLDGAKMVKHELSGKLGFQGDWYFYYGNGDYGTWPTKALNEEHKGISSNFKEGDYVNKTMEQIMAEYEEAHYEIPSEPDYPAYPAYPYSDGRSIYLNVDSLGWKNFNTIMIYLYEHNGDVLIQWQSKKGKMDNMGNGFYSFDLEKKGYPLSADKEYACIFLADTGVQTCDLMIGPDCYGDTAKATGQKIENTEDSNKKSDGVRWSKNRSKGVPKSITAIGNVVGDTYWKGDSDYAMFVAFLKDTGKKGVGNAVKFNGKTVQQTIDDTAMELGLSLNDVERAIDASGRKGQLDWSPERSPLYVPVVPESPTVMLYAQSDGVLTAWNSVENAEKYILYYKKQGASSWSSITVYGTNYILTNLEPGAVYNVQVQSIGANNTKGKYSSVKTVTIPSSAPVLSLSNKSNGIRAEWNKVDGASKYIVYYRKNSDSKWSSVETVNNYYPLLNLTAGTQYAVQVQAVYGNYNGAYSSVNRLTYIPQVSPSLTLSNKSNGIRAEWNKVNGATGYIVYYRDADNTKWSSAVTANNYYPLLNLTAGTQYAVQVQTVFGNEKGWYSPVKTLTYIPQVSPSLTLSNKSNGIRAEWNKINGATKYIVYYRRNADSRWSSAETVNNYYPLLNLTAGTQYAVQVQAIYGNYNGAYSSVNRLTYIPQVSPSLTLSNKSNGIRAEWNKINGATKYIVYYRTNSDSKWSSVETVNNYYPLLNLSKGTQYAVQMQAVYGSAKGLYSSVARLTYQPVQNSSAVYPLTLTRQNNSLRVSWNAVSGATKYILYYKVYGSDWSIFELPYTYADFSPMIKGTTYCFQLQPVFGSTKGAYSNVAWITY